VIFGKDITRQVSRGFADQCGQQADFQAVEFVVERGAGDPDFLMGGMDGRMDFQNHMQQ